MHLFSARDVWRRYGETVALRGVSLEIEAPGVYGVIGRSGAGKTTLLRMIPCLLQPDQGTVQVFGLDPWAHQEAIKQRLGYLSEEDTFPPYLQARDLLAVHAACYTNWDAAMATRLIERFDLDIRRPMKALSKGQQRQIGLLCAVCHHPELLVLDEPTGGLDAVARQDFVSVVIDLLAEWSGTVLVGSRQFAEIQRLASRIAVLDRGELIADEAMTSLRDNASRVTVVLGNRHAGVVRATLEPETECVRVRQTDGELTTTWRCPPEAAAERVTALHLTVGDAVGLDLEDFFNDWPGDA